jgi:hypothetical protein
MPSRSSGRSNRSLSRGVEENWYALSSASAYLAYYSLKFINLSCTAWKVCPLTTVHALLHIAWYHPNGFWHFAFGVGNDPRSFARNMTNWAHEGFLEPFNLGPTTLSTSEPSEHRQPRRVGLRCFVTDWSRVPWRRPPLNGRRAASQARGDRCAGSLCRT